MNLAKRTKTSIYNIVENGAGQASRVYNVFMLISITVSLVPLLFKESNHLFIITEKITVTVFIVDYIARFFVSNIKYNNNSALSYIKYIFSPMAIIDLLSILPSLTAFNSALKLLRLSRLSRVIKAIRVVKFTKYSKSVVILSKVLKRSKDSLLAVGGFAIAYILISGLIIFNVEPQSFDTYFDAIYWATVSLTTVGYGDLYPITTAGRTIAMISSFFGIAIVALPSGIVTAGYLEELNEKS